MLPLAIIAGGLATRLRPITETIPKSLVPINGEPFVAHQLRLVQREGVTRVVMCIGYLGEMVRDFVGDGSRFGLHVEYSWDGGQLLGTAGAVQNALPLLGEAFLLMYGDSYLPCDYRAVARTFEASGKLGLMTVYRNGDLFDRSNVEYRDGQIVKYSKTDRTEAMQHIDYGLGALRAEAFRSTAQPPRDLAGLYQDLLAHGQLAAFEVPERFYEIGSFEGIASLEDYLSKEITPHE